LNWHELATMDLKGVILCALGQEKAVESASTN
jgi:hypothetical protein